MNIKSNWKQCEVGEACCADNFNTNKGQTVKAIPPTPPRSFYYPEWESSVPDKMTFDYWEFSQCLVTNGGKIFTVWQRIQ